MTTGDRPRPLRIVNSAAPIRICDNGGWTDTWFAGHGKIFNIGVYPYVEVQIEVFQRSDRDERVVLHAENYGARYVLHPEQSGIWTQHPLLEAAIERMQIPQDLAVEVTIFSEAPAGGSTGTSASVAVALIGALDRLTPGRLSPHEVAYAAHAVEVEMLKQQSGIQDQLCAAYGGINYIEMFAYPHAAVSPIQVPDATWWELERRLALVYLGTSHHSSAVHEMVIRDLEHEGPLSRRLEDLRVTAERSRDALYAGNLTALGRAMIDNTAAQARLHAGLVSADAGHVIAIAREYGAAGWKVNGAGGQGGSVTLLGPALSHVKREMLRAIEAENSLFRNIPVRLSRFGLRVWT